MNTEKLIWFVDCRNYFRTTSLDKLVHLANYHQKKIEIILDASTLFRSRNYWHLFDDKEQLSQTLLASIEKKQQQLRTFFSMNAIKATINVNQDSHYLQLLNATITDSSVVIIEDSGAANRHSIFQKLTEINASVLVLSSKPWKLPIKILAAIDPLHEHARPIKVDDNIALLTKNWAIALKSEWIISHCCHVDPMLAKYKSKVLSMHRDGLTDFAKKHRFSSDKCILLEGVPEYALASYIASQSIDMLTIGLVSRNKLQQFWIGSTTTALLSSPPCDMLLIKH